MKLQVVDKWNNKISNAATFEIKYKHENCSLKLKISNKNV